MPAQFTAPRSYLNRFLAVTVVQALVVYLSLFLVPAGGSGASLVWPPAAVALAFLWFWGLDLWPAIVVAFFVVLIPRGIAPPLIALTALANAIEALLAAYLLREYADFNPAFSRLRDALGFIVTAFIATLASATIITLGVSLFGTHGTPSAALWMGIWIGHTVSLISFGPFLIRWLYRPNLRRTTRQWVEGGILFGVLVVLVVLLFWTSYTAVGGISLLYVAIIPLIWAALRTGPRGMSLALFLFAIIGATGVIFGGHLLPTQNIAQVLFGVQMIIGVLSIIFLLFTSITEERKEAVVSLQSHVGALEQALDRISSDDQAKTDFIAILAHELRNPLSPLLSGLELLKLGQGSEDVLRMMGAHLHSVARILDDLLDISRISQKKFVLQKEPVEMHVVIKQSLEMVKPQIEMYKHTLEVVVPEEELWLNGDSVRLTQIVVNLLNNAAKYTKPGGHIRLVLEHVGDVLLVRVADNGMGIDPKRLEKIFEAFGTSDNVEYVLGGLHIGLSLARRMAQMHHGEIAVRSAGVGKGSEFTVQLPLLPIAPLALGTTRTPTRGRFSKEALQESRAKGKRLSILVVDDNEAAAQNLRKLLEHSGHQVWVAYDAPEALVIAKREQPQAALLDIGLPTMSGYELAKEMRRQSASTVLIALTGYGQGDDKEKSKKAGFAEHLVKPVSIVDVERVLTRLLP